jgi:hypothetical protein
MTINYNRSENSKRVKPAQGLNIILNISHALAGQPSLYRTSKPYSPLASSFASFAGQLGPAQVDTQHHVAVDVSAPLSVDDERRNCVKIQ